MTIDGIAGLKANDIREAARTALRAVGRLWIDKFLPIHFTNAANSRYGYTARSQYYRYRKRQKAEIGGFRAIGEDKPLVWSGRSRERAKMARAEAKAPSSRSAYVDIIIDAPALNFKPTGSTIDMRDEVTRVIQPEIDELAALFVREFDAALEKKGRSRRRLRAA